MTIDIPEKEAKEICTVVTAHQSSGTGIECIDLRLMVWGFELVFTTLNKHGQFTGYINDTSGG